MLDIHSSIRDKLNYFYKIHKIPNIIFHGTSGSGKKTIVNEFIHKIYDNNKEKIKDFVMYVNCAHGKGIKFIREELKFFAKTHINSNGGDIFKSIILLNADKLTMDGQSALRRCIELFSHTTRFFIIVEDKYKLLKPILSRFCEIYIPEPIFENKLINLYQYNLSRTFHNEDSKQKKLEWLKKELDKNMSSSSRKKINGKCMRIPHVYNSERPNRSRRGQRNYFNHQQKQNLQNFTIISNSLFIIETCAARFANCIDELFNLEIKLIVGWISIGTPSIVFI